MVLLAQLIPIESVSAGWVIHLLERMFSKPHCSANEMKLRLLVAS
jgi:hypothetical protein